MIPKDKTNIYLLSIVSIVAVVGIVILILSQNKETTSPGKTAFLKLLSTNLENSDVVYYVIDENGMNHIETMNDRLWKDQILQTVKEREASGYPVWVLSFLTIEGRTCYYVASADILESDFDPEAVGVAPGEIGIYCFREDGLLVTKPAFSLHESTIYVEGYSVDAETKKKLDELYLEIHPQQ